MRTRRTLPIRATRACGARPRRLRPATDAAHSAASAGATLGEWISRAIIIGRGEREPVTLEEALDAARDRGDEPRVLTHLGGCAATKRHAFPSL